MVSYIFPDLRSTLDLSGFHLIIIAIQKQKERSAMQSACSLTLTWLMAYMQGPIETYSVD